MGLRPAKSHEKLSGRPVGGRDFVGQVGNLRPIGNRPLPPSRWTGGGNQPPRRLPTCPTLVFRPCRASPKRDRRQKAIVCPTAPEKDIGVTLLLFPLAFSVSGSWAGCSQIVLDLFEAATLRLGDAALDEDEQIGRAHV